MSASNPSLALLQRALPAVAQYMAAPIAAAADRHGVDPLFAAAFPSWESAHWAVGPNGTGDDGESWGPWQIYKPAHPDFFKAGDLSIEAQTDYAIGSVIRPNIDHFGGMNDAAIAAYNGGIGRVQRNLNAGRDPGYGTAKTPYGNYVDAIRHEWDQLKAAAGQETVS